MLFFKVLSNSALIINRTIQRYTCTVCGLTLQGNAVNVMYHLRRGMNLEQSCTNSITLRCKLSSPTVPVVVRVEIRTTESYVILSGMR